MENTQKEIKNYLEKYNKLWPFGGSIITSFKNNVIFSESYGKANFEFDIDNNENTKYRLYSLSKQFTAFAIMLLEYNGLLNVHEPIYKYFQEYPEINKKIAIHHLLTHTSGIIDYFTLPNFVYNTLRLNIDINDFLLLFINKPLLFNPGNDLKYSGSGYTLLRLIIEKVANIGFEEYLKENIFKPFEMNDTGLFSEYKIIPNMANGYDHRGTELSKSIFIEMNNLYGAGGAYSTILDLYRWDQKLYFNKLLPKKYIERMLTPYKNNYGYGWGIYKIFNQKVVQHGGALPGTGGITCIRRFLDTNSMIAVLSNYGVPDVWKITNDIAAIIFNQEYKHPMKPKKMQIYEKDLKKYEGYYNGFMEFIIKVKKDKLLLDFNLTGKYGTHVFCYYPIGKNIFQNTSIDEKIQFEEDKNGNISLWGIQKIKK